MINHVNCMNSETEWQVCRICLLSWIHILLLIRATKISYIKAHVSNSPSVIDSSLDHLTHSPHCNITPVYFVYFFPPQTKSISPHQEFSLTIPGEQSYAQRTACPMSGFICLSPRVIYHGEVACWGKSSLKAYMFPCVQPGCQHHEKWIILHPAHRCFSTE